MCNRIPTEWQPTDENWKCPKCGSKEPFRIVNNFETEEDCSLLHEEDICSCKNCDSLWTGKNLSTVVLETERTEVEISHDNLLCCPFCGSKARIVVDNPRLPNGKYDTLYQVQCTLQECQVCTKYLYPISAAVIAWNRRTLIENYNPKSRDFNE